MTVKERAMTTDQRTESEQFQNWVILEILEIMGHRRLAGFLTEQEIAGAAFLRIDIPLPEPEGLSEAERRWLTQFYAPSAVYAITPCTEEVAREIAKQAPQPLSVWDVRALLPEIEAEVKREIENEVREEAWKKQRQVMNVYTAGEPDEGDVDYAADGPAF